jgi:hypothetical protein
MKMNIIFFDMRLKGRRISLGIALLSIFSLFVTNVPYHFIEIKTVNSSKRFQVKDLYPKFEAVVQ